MKIHIIGAGITGLTAAWYLQDLGEVHIFEKTDRVGGWIQTHLENDFCFELGPRGFRSQGKGRATLALCKALDLEPLLASESAKRRYLLDRGKIRLISPFYLLYKGGLLALLRDFLVKPAVRQEESVAQFFSRHLGRRFAERFAEPLTRGIFGGDYHLLSAKSCFPSLWQRDQERGPFLSFKKEKGNLCSFVDGMEELPRRIAEKVHAEIHLGHFVEESDADIVIWTNVKAPKSISLTTLHLGWHELSFPYKGFGFLVPSLAGENFLGISWDSLIFPQQRGKYRFSLMTREEGDDVTLLALAKRALSTYMGVDKEPDFFYIHRAKEAIPQYEIGHEAWISAKNLCKKPHHYYLGNSFYGVGVNDCVFQAQRLAASLKDMWS